MSSLFSEGLPRTGRLAGSVVCLGRAEKISKCKLATIIEKYLRSPTIVTCFNWQKLLISSDGGHSTFHRWTLPPLETLRTASVPGVASQRAAPAPARTTITRLPGNKLATGDR